MARKRKIDLTLQEAIAAEETDLTANRHNDSPRVTLLLRDKEEAYNRFKMTSHQCEVVTPSGSSVRIDRRAGTGTIVEIPMESLEAAADKQFLAGIFGEVLFGKLAGIPEPETDQGSVCEQLRVKVNLELRPLTKRIHDFVAESIEAQKAANNKP